MNASTTATAADKKPQAEKTTDVIEMRQLLECGVHFGHQTKRWNPKMKPYIFTARNGIHVIDLQKSIKLIRQIYTIVKDTVAKNGNVLFVGTKKQAQSAIESEAKRCEMPFVNHRWLGGTLTNNITIRQSINKLKKFEVMVDDGSLDSLSNKEASRKKKTLTRLDHYLGGIKDMVGVPSLLFVVDTKREQLAVNEARKLNIPIIGLVDTNADPTEVDYPIPGNDDAIRAIKLICSVIANASNEGLKERAEIESIKAALAEKNRAEEEAKKEAEKANRAKTTTAETVVKKEVRKEVKTITKPAAKKTVVKKDDTHNTEKKEVKEVKEVKKETKAAKPAAKKITKKKSDTAESKEEKKDEKTK